MKGGKIERKSKGKKKKKDRDRGDRFLQGPLTPQGSIIQPIMIFGLFWEHTLLASGSVKITVHGH